MTIEIKVPTLGESVTEATVGQWFKKPGEAVKVDEPLVELETDKVTVEVPAPAAGVLADIKVAQGTTVEHRRGAGLHQRGCRGAAPAPQAAAPAKAPERPQSPRRPTCTGPAGNGGMPPSPSARRVMEEKGVSAADVQGSGRRGQILKEDATAACRSGSCRCRAAAAS